MRFPSLNVCGGLLFAAIAFCTAQPAAAQTTQSSLPGANNWTCQPSAAHPRPVVLVHGLWATMEASWLALSPILASKGYCVFALNYGAGQYGIGGTAPMESSAVELSNFVTQVLNATHAAQVDIVGHSEGALMPRYYLKNLGGASYVHSLIGLSPPNHGTDVDGLITLAQSIPAVGGLVQQGFASFCPACVQFITGSTATPFLATLNAGSDTVPGVQYTVVMSKLDGVVTPYTSAFLTGSNVTNITLQNQCAFDGATHLTIPFDSLAVHNVLNALDPAHATAVSCFG